MKRRFSFTWTLVGALRTPTLTKEVSTHLLKAKMRRGGTADRATPALTALQCARRMEKEEEEEIENEEEEEAAGEHVCPLLGEILKID